MPALMPAQEPLEAEIRELYERAKRNFMEMVCSAGKGDGKIGSMIAEIRNQKPSDSKLIFKKGEGWQFVKTD